MSVFGERAVGDWRKLSRSFNSLEGVNSLLVTGILINKVDINEISGGSEMVG